MPYLVLDPALAQAAPATSIGAPSVTSDSYTLQELYSELMLRLGDRTDVTMTRATRWINDAIMDIASSLDLPGLKGDVAIVTTPGQSLYLLPNNLKEVSTIVATDGSYERYLVEMDERKMRMLTTVEGQATHYYQRDNLLVLYPAPTTVETVIVGATFKPKPLDALDSAKRHILPSDWNEGLLRLATQYGFAALLEPELAANAENQYISWVRRQDDPNSQNTNSIARFTVPRCEKDLRRARYSQSYLECDDGGRW